MLGAEGLTKREMGAQAVGEGQELAGPYLAALTSDAAVVITGCLVPTHDTLLVFVQVTRDIPWEGGRGGRQAGMAGAPGREALTLSASPGFPLRARPLAQPPGRAASWRHTTGYLLHPLP